MGTQRLDFAEFYRGSRDDCLRTVLVSVGHRDTAQDLVDEAFARACASWRTVSKHPAPEAWVIWRYTEGDESGLIGKVFQHVDRPNVTVIHASALPSGAGVQLSPVINLGQVPAIAVGIVKASPQCTGS